MEKIIELCKDIGVCDVFTKINLFELPNDKQEKFKSEILKFTGADKVSISNGDSDHMTMKLSNDNLQGKSIEISMIALTPKLYDPDISRESCIHVRDTIFDGKISPVILDSDTHVPYRQLVLYWNVEGMNDDDSENVYNLNGIIEYLNHNQKSLHGVLLTCKIKK